MPDLRCMRVFCDRPSRHSHARTNTSPPTLLPPPLTYFCPRQGYRRAPSEIELNAGMPMSHSQRPKMNSAPFQVGWGGNIDCTEGIHSFTPTTSTAQGHPPPLIMPVVERSSPKLKVQGSSPGEGVTGEALHTETPFSLVSTRLGTNLPS